MENRGESQRHPTERRELTRLLAEHHRADPLTRPSADLSPRGRGGRDETRPACFFDGAKDETDRPRPVRGEG
jgi:hypothetical protein